MALDVQASLDMGSARRILNLPAPASANEPARLTDLQSALEGLSWKDSVRVAAGTNITVASPGASIDGIAMSANDRVLLRAQTAGAENGIYVWNGAATPMTRALDASTADELEQAVVTVEEGTSAGTSYRQTLVNFTLGTGQVAWATFGTAASAATESTAGIAEIATQAETDAGTDGARIVTPLKLANYSGRAKRFAANVGDGSATSITVTHNLNTRDVQVQVYRNSGNYDQVLVETLYTSVNSVTLVFDSAPAANAFRCVVMA
ncbi:MAG: hypothetical protein KA742_13930 [Pseudoxanthomonas sp.]|nr:hypothetical protein [Pseudoxanthomonas sp.]